MYQPFLLFCFFPVAVGTTWKHLDKIDSASVTYLRLKFCIIKMFRTIFESVHASCKHYFL